MKTGERRKLIYELREANYQLDAYLEDNGGELDEVSSAMEQSINDMVAELVGDVNTPGAIDDLGRWLASVMDEQDRMKAEIKMLQARKKRTDEKIEFIKEEIRRVMDACAMTKAKGELYGFSAYTKSATTVDEDKFMEVFGEQLNGVRQLFPDWVDVKLEAKSSRVPEGDELPEYFVTETTDTVKFSKPRKS